MFHSCNGYFWCRLDNGSVRLIKTNQGDSPKVDGSNWESFVTFTPDMWASIIQQVSPTENKCNADVHVFLKAFHLGDKLNFGLPCSGCDTSCDEECQT